MVHLLTLAVNRGFSEDTPSGPGPVVNIQCETERSCITLNGSSYGKVVVLVADPGYRTSMLDLMHVGGRTIFSA